MISDALAYPFKGTGKYILIIGAILSLLVSAASYIPFLGLIIAICVSGYFTAYMFDVINSSACGRDEACEWPVFQDFFSDLVMPWLRMLSASFFSFVPYVLVSILFEDSRLLSIASLVLGFVHLPMAILCVAICRTMRSAFWTITLPIIANCLPQYFILVLVIGGLSLLNRVLNNVLSNIPILGWFISFFLGMYSLMVSGRIIGLFYRENKHLIE
jgi:hypothetical protein